VKSANEKDNMALGRKAAKPIQYEEDKEPDEIAYTMDEMFEKFKANQGLDLVPADDDIVETNDGRENH